MSSLLRSFLDSIVQSAGVQWVKRHLMTLVFFLAKHVFRVDVHQHLAHPGTGIGKWIVSRVFKNNIRASDTLLSLLSFPDRASVVEIGFGLGDTLKSAIMKAPPNSSFAGYELSESMLMDARQNIGDDPRVQLSLRDCAKDGIPHRDESVDVIYHANVIYFVPDPLAFLKECCRVLKQGGQLGMNVIQPTELGELPSDTPFKNLLPEEDLRRLCREAGFASVQVTPYSDSLNRMLIVATKG